MIRLLKGLPIDFEINMEITDIYVN